MNKLSKLTRMNIVNLFKYGFRYKTYIKKIDYYEREYQEEVLEEGRVNFHGRLNEIDFLKRLYDLEEMVGTDNRFDNVLQDIYQHRVRNWDWEDDWIFEYEPFNLIDCNDEVFLKFVAEVFNPYVRDDKTPWNTLLIEIGKLVDLDGFEVYVAEKISGQDVYAFKEKQSKLVRLNKEIVDTLSN